MLFVEGLFHLLSALQKAYVLREFICALRHARKRGKDKIIYFSGICLPRNGYRGRKAERFNYIFVQGFDLFVVAVEKLQKACLRPRSTLYAAHDKSVDDVRKVLHIQQKILEPQSSPLSDGDKLRGLQVGEPESGRFFVFFRKISEPRHDRRYFVAHHRERFAVYDDVGVVGDVAAGSAEVYDRRRLRTRDAVGINVRHDVVSDESFALGGKLEVYVVEVRFEFLYLLVRDIEPQSLLPLGEFQPKPAEEPYPVRFRERGAHFARGVTSYKRIIVYAVIGVH